MAYHARSISLPSRPHPVVDQLDEQLCRLRSSQTASTSSSSSLSQTLSGLSDLYACVDDLLLLPISHQSKMTNDMLDESLRLLDTCATARDSLVQTKEAILNIQSVLRRRYSGELSIDDEIVHYLNARKIVKKAIKICLKDTKKDDKKDEVSATVGMLKEVATITTEVFKSLLIQIAGSRIQSKKSGWSLVNKFVNHRCDKEHATMTSEFEDLDTSLSLIISQKKKTGINMMQVENLRSQMAKLESKIQELDEVLESLFRHLVKTRATLLNILSN